MPGNPNSNPYRRLTEEEKKLAEKKRLELEKTRKEAEEQAIKCLNHKDFVKYRVKYEKLERLTIAHLIDYNDPEPIRFAFNCRRMLDELRQLKLFIHDVEVDNRPRGKK